VVIRHREFTRAVKLVLPVCRRAVLGESPWNLIGPDERML